MTHCQIINQTQNITHCNSLFLIPWLQDLHNVKRGFCSQNEPTVYDPRLEPHKPRGGNVDVFELNRPRAHRRPSDDTRNGLSKF